MTTKSIPISLLLTAIVAGWGALSIFGARGSADGFLLLLLVGVAIAGIGWHPESSGDAG